MPARPAHHPLATLAGRDPAATPDRRIPRRYGVPSAVRTVDDALARPDRRRPHLAAVDPTAPSASSSSAGVRSATTALVPASRPSADRSRWHAQDGSVATEYGLLAVVAATIVSVILEWATGGGITDLLTAVMDRVSELVGL